MKIDILTLFPEMFKGPFDESIIKRAREKDLVEINIHNLRDWAKDKHKTVDDRAYGGGKGMVLKVMPIYNAIKDLKTSKSTVILLSPRGMVFAQKKARDLSKLSHLILICGHYEGFDERIRKHLIDKEISIGDYVLTGGELPAMIITDSIVRLLPNVLDPEAIRNESFSDHHTTVRGSSKAILDYPVYTRPAKFKNWKVPEVLLSGNHAEIKKWRKQKSLEKT